MNNKLILPGFIEYFYLVLPVCSTTTLDSRESLVVTRALKDIQMTILDMIGHKRTGKKPVDGVSHWDAIR